MVWIISYCLTRVFTFYLARAMTSGWGARIMVLRPTLIHMPMVAIRGWILGWDMRRRLS
jgi:hypothetical protein